MEILVLPGAAEEAEGCQLLELRRGPSFAPFGGSVEKRTMPSKRPWFTPWNSPAIEIVSPTPVIERPACPIPVVVPT